MGVRLDVVVVALVALVLWQLWAWVGVLGFWLRPRTWSGSSVDRGVRLVVVVPARGEGRVLASCLGGLSAQVASLSRLGAWSGGVRVVLVADGGLPEDVAMALGVCGCVVVDSGGAGKQEALRQAWVALGNPVRTAVMVCDADSLPGPGLVAEALRWAQEARWCAQARLRSHGARSSSVRAISAGYAVSDVTWQQARSRWGAVVAAGTGMVYGCAVLESGWPSTGQAEDLEVSCRVVLGGGQVDLLSSWVSDQKPATWRGAYRQRVRWMRGHMRALRRYGLALLARPVAGWDLAAYLASPFVGALVMVAFVALAARSVLWFAAAVVGSGVFLTVEVGAAGGSVQDGWLLVPLGVVAAMAAVHGGWQGVWGRVRAWERTDHRAL